MSRYGVTASCSVLCCLFSPELHCTVSPTVVHDPRVYRLKAGTTVCAVRACIPDQHVGFPSLCSVHSWAPMLCAFITAAIIIVDVSSLACQHTLHPLYAFCTPAFVTLFGRPLGGACVHLLVRFCGPEGTRIDSPKHARPRLCESDTTPALRIN
jgi:hypothetical protein